MLLPCFPLLLLPPCFPLLPLSFPRHAHRHHAHSPLLVTQAVESVHGALPYFRKAEPAWLQLPGYTPSELAAMSHQLLTAAGYSLPVVPARDATSLLQQAICATWPRDVIALRNAHLAAELVQRAISNRYD